MDTAGFDPTDRWDIAHLQIPAGYGPFHHCYSTTLSQAMRISVGWTAAIVVVAFVVYRVGPLWTRRSALGAVPAQMRPALERLVETAGLASRPPDFMVALSDSSTDAATVRRGGRTTVCLCAGLVKEGFLHPNLLRAVVLHELAHVHNRDVPIGYGARALWLVFVLGVAAPGAALHIWLSTGIVAPGPYSQYWPDGPMNPVHELVFLVLAVAIGYLMHAGLQRTREHVADHDARAWGADREVWKILEGGADEQLEFQWTDRLLYKLRLHPGTRKVPRGTPLVSVCLRMVVNVMDRFAEIWRTHPMSARRSRWLAESGSVDENHGRFLPIFLAVGACMLTMLGLNGMGAADGPALAVLFGLVAVTVLTMVTLEVSKGESHQWADNDAHDTRRDRPVGLDQTNLADPLWLEREWPRGDGDNKWV